MLSVPLIKAIYNLLCLKLDWYKHLVAKKEILLYHSGNARKYNGVESAVDLSLFLYSHIAVCNVDFPENINRTLKVYCLSETQGTVPRH